MKTQFHRSFSQAYPGKHRRDIVLDEEPRNIACPMLKVVRVMNYRDMFVDEWLEPLPSNPLTFTKISDLANPRIKVTPTLLNENENQYSVDLWSKFNPNFVGEKDDRFKSNPNPRFFVRDGDIQFGHAAATRQLRMAKCLETLNAEKGGTSESYLTDYPATSLVTRNTEKSEKTGRSVVTSTTSAVDYWRITVTQQRHAIHALPNLGSDISNSVPISTLALIAEISARDHGHFRYGHFQENWTMMHPCSGYFSPLNWLDVTR